MAVSLKVDDWQSDRDMQILLQIGVEGPEYKKVLEYIVLFDKGRLKSDISMLMFSDGLRVLRPKFFKLWQFCLWL